MKQNFTYKGLPRLYFFMRVSMLNLLLLIMPCLQVLSLGTATGQKISDTYVTIRASHTSLKSIFNLIEDKTKFLFVFAPELIERYNDIKIDVENESLEKVLKSVLEHTELGYRGNNLNILIFKLKSPPSINNLKIQGQVVEASSGRELPGVNVLVKGTSLGTTTDANGEFSIDASGSDILIFSFIGFKSLEVVVGNQTMLRVPLEDDIMTLRAVEVNAGYYRVEERETTGSISRVSGDIIRSQPVNNFLGAMIARVPGVQIQQISGVPGGGYSLQIRGRNSLRSGVANAPLYIVDGVPFSSATISSSLVGGEIVPDASPLNMIPPSDIESIEVLKDADATAIYGSRGANGVVLITTKRAKRGNTKINFSYSKGWGRVAKKVDLLNTQQYVEMRKEAFANDEMPMEGYSAVDLLEWDTTRYTDWQDVLIGNTANYSNSQISISSGTDNTQFYLSGNYSMESTVFPSTDGLKRGGLGFSLSHQAFDNKVKVSFSGNYTAIGNKLPRVDLTQKALTLPPNAPEVYDESGELNWENYTWINPFAEVRKRYRSDTDNLVARAAIEVNVLKDFLLKVNSGYNVSNSDEISITPISSGVPVLPPDASSAYSNGKRYSWVVEPQVEFNKKMEEATVDVLLGSTFQNSSTKRSASYAYGFTNDALIENPLAAAGTRLMNFEDRTYRYAAIFGRINYNLRGKYIINITGRRDGSSKFGPGRRFGNFGAVGLAWIFSEEPIIRNSMQFISFGKLRTSYGTTGSDQIDDFQYLSSYRPSYYIYNGVVGLVPSRLANPDYSWETTRKFEINLDLGIAKDVVMMSASWYRNISSNQLIGYPLPSIVGQQTIQYNLPATVENTGWEFSVNSRNFNKSNFVWSTSLNFTLPKNKLVEFPNLAGSSYARSYEIGYPLSVRKKIHQLGVDPETGLYQFEDVDGNGVLENPTDYKIRRNVQQKYYGGFGNTIQLRNFQIEFLFQYVKQTGYDYRYYSNSLPGTMSNQVSDVMNRWRQPGDNAELQRFSMGIDAANVYDVSRYYSDRSIVDASFVRLKNASVSYIIQNSIIERAGVSDIKVYLQGQNLLTWTNYVGSDPETQNLAMLPPLRVIMLGIQISL